MLKQILGQFEQLCLKLGLKNGYTLTVLNFKQQFVPQKWPRMGKGAITKGLNISFWDLKKVTRNGIWLQIFFSVKMR